MTSRRALGDGRVARPSLTLHLLGDFRLTYGATIVIARDWPRRKAAALLKALALTEDRAIHRERLMELLWPDLEPTRAATQLYKSLHWVRERIRDAGEQGLTPTSVVAVGGGIVRLAHAVTVDVERFRTAANAALAAPPDPVRLEAALSLYVGDLLPDDLLEEWADGPREELRSIRRRLVLARADGLEGTGDLETAIVALESLVRAEPWEESAHRRLIRLRGLVGDAGGAVRQYRACRDALRREIGVAPAVETELELRTVLEPRARHRLRDRESFDEILLLEQLGDVERRTGDVRRSARLYAQALDRAGGEVDQAALLRLRAKALLGHLLDGDVVGAGAFLTDIRRELEAQAPAYVTARTYYLLAQLRWHSGNSGAALEAAERSLAAARSSADARRTAQALEILALACHSLGYWRRGLEAELERQALAVDDGFDVGEALEGHACLWEYQLYGDVPYAAVERQVRDLLVRAEGAGNRRALALCQLALGSVLFVTGRWQEAAVALATSGRLAESVGAEQVAIHAEQRLGRLETAQGRLAAGAQRLRSALDRAHRSRSAQVRYHSRTRILASLAQNALQAGTLALAVRSLDHAALVQDQIGDCATCDALLYPTSVPVLLVARQSERAERGAERATENASAFGSRSWGAAGRHARGLVAAAGGDRSSAIDDLTAARATFHEIGQPYDEARATEALAAVVALGAPGRGARDRAARLGAAAERLYRRLGAAPNPERLDHVLGSGKVGGRQRT